MEYQRILGAVDFDFESEDQMTKYSEVQSFESQTNGIDVVIIYTENCWRVMAAFFLIHSLPKICWKTNIQGEEQRPVQVPGSGIYKGT